jgi:hypothetical protein
MSDPIETAVEAVAESNVISIPFTAVAVTVSLAAYGAQDLTRKGVKKAKLMRENRKAKKALKDQTPEPSPQS